jgi:hypothetical protein
MTDTMTSQNIVLSSWDTLYIVSECVVIGIQHAIRMRLIVIRFLINGTIFEKRY